MPLEPSERATLLELAHRSIAEGRPRAQPPPRQSWPPSLTEWRAAFVTLRREGELRGCRGTIEPRGALAEEVWHNAWASAYTDPRFPPIAPEELDTLEVAISVLTPLERLEAQSDEALAALLRPGLDGLVLRCGSAAATFLPAVWEMLPDPRQFIAQLKVKAGWPPRHWPVGMAVLRYGAETFLSSPARSP